MKHRPSFPKTRRFTLPLYGKILFWFSLNILLALAIAVWFLHTHFGMDQSWLLGEAARGRIQALSAAVTHELRQSPRSEWSAILEQAGAAHHVRLGLFEPGGAAIAPGGVVLPDAVRDKLRPGALPGGGGRGFRGQTTREGNLRPGPRGERRGSFAEGGPGLENFDFPKEALRTRDPTAYWFIVRLPGPERPPWILVGTSDTLGGTGLFFDPKPWIWAAVGVAGFSALLWLPFARGLTRSIREMNLAAEEISRGNFDTRVNDSRGDELGRLGSAINRMSSRLEGLVAGQKRFMGDIGHELCAPLARMEVGMGVIEQRSSPDELGRLAAVREDVGEMRELVGELLSFSKTGLKPTSENTGLVHLHGLVENAAHREAGSVEVINNVPADLGVEAVPLLLARAVANLMRNAVAHGAGPVEIDAVETGKRVLLRVSDRGPGVPEEALPHLFDPFYRVDTSRSRDTGGTGLGLAIVNNCVRSFGGAVTARNRPGGGFTVEIELRRAKTEIPIGGKPA